MKLRIVWYTLALVMATALVTREVVSQEKETPTKPPSGAPGKAKGASDSEALVEMWVKYAMPDEHHQVLGRMAGRWNLAIKYWMSADAPVVESKGTATRKWILGNRFLLEEFDGGNLAMPFQGLAVYGYDPFERKYTSAWVDTMSTAITTNLGTCGQPCDLITFEGQRGDPWTGTKRHSRGVTRLVHDNQHVLEVYEPGSDGKEYKILEIVYTRTEGPTTGPAT